MSLQALPPQIRKIRRQWPTLKDFAGVFSPQETRRFAQYPDRCITGDAPTLTDIKLSYGRTAHKQWLIAQLAMFQEGLNVDNKMTARQMEACADVIATDFHYLKATEIMLFLYKLQGGAYNTDWFGTISTDKIVRALQYGFLPRRNGLLRLKSDEEAELREREERNKPHMTREEYERIKRGREDNEAGIVALRD